MNASSAQAHIKCARAPMYGWHYHYAPVYWHGGYAPIVVTPFVHTTYVGCLGCYYVGCATCYYRFHHNGYTYDYYSSKDYLPQKSDVNPTEMAWACPSKSVCCGWECCKEPQEEEEESGITTVGWVFIGIGIFIIVCLLIGCIWCCCRNSREAAYYDHHMVAAPTPVVHCGGYGSGGVVAYPVEPLY
ncbi:hypothetical protein PRIPAC_74650 [Pristionchus pacificus]|uniref:Uncharacterized protein n=1 Tax=Pristionchus pacificus TaxID=54126 RepID=A0A2A6C765_PRIPA|nr:hypothetical protein PRIPAC_74650 [Pristionchus pacificus]|eukprot:PDM73908.1 hypothetical protein PRIPAC_41264 [Pristionchus pacificus]